MALPVQKRQRRIVGRTKHEMFELHTCYSHKDIVPRMGLVTVGAQQICLMSEWRVVDSVLGISFFLLLEMHAF